MIKLNTTEKWIELDKLENPIKAEFDTIWVKLSLEERNRVTLGFDFGKMTEIEGVNTFVKSGHGFYYPVSKTDAEIKTYSYDQLHLDAKAILEAICLSEVTFAIS